MKRISLAVLVATSALTSTFSTFSNASSPTDPIVVVGVLGSYSELEFKGKRNTDTEHMPEGGLFLSYGNKMTAREGLFYNGELSGNYSKRDDQEVKDVQADLDLGWRFAVDAHNAVDVLVGAGYKWNRFQPASKKYDIDFTSRTPFIKIAAGYNHSFDNATLRLEAGLRNTVNGDARLKISRIDSESDDLKDSTNPFVEVSLLFNQQGALPVLATLYYNHFKYDVDGTMKVSEFDRQTRNEFGAKIGIAF